MYIKDTRVVTYTPHKAKLNKMKGKASLSSFLAKIIDLYVEAMEKKDGTSDE